MIGNYRYVPGLGYAIRFKKNWVVHSPGRPPQLLSGKVDLNLLEKAYWESMGSQKTFNIFDNPSPQCRHLSGFRSPALVSGNDINFLDIEIAASEVMVWRDLTISKVTDSGQYGEANLHITVFKDQQRILPEIVGGAAYSTTIQVRMIAHGKFNLRVNLRNASAATYNPFLAWSMWAVPEEIYNKYYVAIG